MIKRILVAVDFTPSSLNAAYYAVQVARQKSASITFIHVYFNPVTDPVSFDHFYSFPANIGESISELIETSNSQMKEFFAKVNFYIADHKFSGIQMKTEVIGGTAEEVILDFAEAGHFNLIIVGVRGKEESKNWFGNFVTDVINKAQIPVLAIPGHASYKDSMFKRLMYATNFEKSDGMAIRRLIEIANPLETHISIVHIDDTEDNPFTNYDLAQFKKKYISDDLPIEMEFDLIINKNKARGIENYIIDHQIDIISVTSHKRNILTSLFKPSLTKELLFRLEIPMLIFHLQPN